MPDKPIHILGIESSCDETSAAVTRDTFLLSNIIANQDTIHRFYGGVVPELASRAHQQKIIPVVTEALIQANITKNELDAVAFTRGPGLMGALLVGVSFAKSLALALDIPLIEVNHMQGHVLAHFVDDARKQRQETAAGSSSRRQEEEAAGGSGGRQEETAAGGSGGRQEETAAGGSGRRQEETAAGGSGRRQEETAAGGSGGRQEETVAGGSDGRQEETAAGGSGRRQEETAAGGSGGRQEKKENRQPSATNRKPSFPFLCLTVSGGHTQIVKVNDYLDMEILGETNDDAAGEAFDKAAKIMGLPYPGGILIDKLAAQGNEKAFKFPHPHAPGYNFSFSGLKTAFLNFINQQIANDAGFIENKKADICASYQKTIVDILMAKLTQASEDTGIRDIAISGGVSANSGLRKSLLATGEKKGWNTFIAPLELCTDNAGMIAIGGYYKYLVKDFSNQKITPLARMPF